MTPPIHCIEASHKTARLTLREALAQATQPAIAAFARQRRELLIDEFVPLSTCGRFELYYVSTVARSPIDLLHHTTGLSRTMLRDAVRTRTAQDAVHHLLRVAAGLESPIIGENQILGQVRNAFLDAQASGHIGPVLSALFRAAIHAGRRVRTETDLTVSASSYARFAVSEAMRAVNHPANVLLVGSGAIARQIATALHTVEATCIIVAGRHLPRAAALAHEFASRAAHYHELPKLLSTADAVIACTRGPAPVIDTSMLAGRSRPVTIIDLGMPRNVAPNVSHRHGVRLITLADLVGGDPLPADVLATAEAILGQEQTRFQRWLSARDNHLAARMAAETRRTKQYASSPSATMQLPIPLMEQHA
jgi:glutamyl-tRNA reductase